MFTLAAAGCGIGQQTAAAPPTPETTSAVTATTETPLPTASPVITVASAPGADNALKTLNTLAVKGRAPKTGYDRDLFGQACSDDVTVDSGHNGCDTRNDIVRWT